MLHPISSHSYLLGSGVVTGTGAGDIAGICILAVPFNCCVTLGNLFNLSVSCVICED